MLHFVVHIVMESLIGKLATTSIFKDVNGTAGFRWGRKRMQHNNNSPRVDALKEMSIYEDGVALRHWPAFTTFSRDIA